MPEIFVVGVDGSDGSRRALHAAARAAERLGARVDVPVAFHDERLTTRQAERTGGTAGADSRAAAHLLEAYLTLYEGNAVPADDALSRSGGTGSVADLDQTLARASRELELAQVDLPT